MKIRNACSLVLMCVFGVFTGCGGAHNSVRGKVVQGPVSFVMSVAENDERLNAPGLADVAVEAKGGTGRGAGMSYASATSDQLGEFRLPFGDQQVLMKPIEFSGDKPGYVSAKLEMSMPSSQRRLLIVLQPADSKPPR